jgi:hypothetical protein
MKREYSHRQKSKKLKLTNQLPIAIQVRERDGDLVVTSGDYVAV